MDISEVYIKMCEKAEGIQRLRDAKRIGDYFFSQLDIERCVFHNYPYPEQPSHTTAECYASEVIIWLPRQDQLQEMIDLDPYSLKFFQNRPSELIVRVYYRYNPDINEYPYQLVGASMEQLWLAFVMKEKYGKIWDEEKWVSQSTRCEDYGKDGN